MRAIIKKAMQGKRFNPAILFSLLLCLTFALFIPPGGGFDEPMHIARAAQISQGQLLPLEITAEDLEVTLVHPWTTEYDLYGGEEPSSLYWLTVSGNLTLQKQENGILVGQRGWVFPTWNDSRLEQNGYDSSETVKYLFSNTAINCPVAYLPQVIGYKVAALFTSNPYIQVIAMRLAAVGVLVMAVFTCVRIIPLGKACLSYVLFLPYLAGSLSCVTADTMTFISALFFTSILMRFLLCSPTNKDYIALLISTIIMCLTKMTYAPLALLLLLLPLACPRYRNGKHLLSLFSIGVISLAASVFWYLQIRAINTGVMWKAGVDPDAQLSFVLLHPLYFAKLVAKQLISVDILCLQPMSIGGGLISSTAYLILFLIPTIHLDIKAFRNCEHTKGAILPFIVFGALVYLLIFMLICLATYLQFTVPALDGIEGVQTRYVAPVLPLLYLLIIFAVGGATETRVDQANGKHAKLASGNGDSEMREKAVHGYVPIDPFAGIKRPYIALYYSALSITSILSFTLSFFG